MGRAEGDGMEDASARRFVPFLHWAGLALVLSPVWLGLARHLASTRFDQYIAVPIVLFAVAARARHAPATAARGGALLLLALGLLLALLGQASASATLSRVGAVLAVLGMGRHLGQLDLALAPLLFLAIPLPAFVTNLTTPWLETAYVSVAEPVFRFLGAETRAFGSVLEIAGQRVELFPEDGGARLAVIGAAFGLFRALGHRADAPGPDTAPARRPVRTHLWAALRGGLLGGAGQLPCVCVACAIAWFGSGAAAALWLGTGAWLSVAGLFAAGGFAHDTAPAHRAKAD